MHNDDDFDRILGRNFRCGGITGRVMLSVVIIQVKQVNFKSRLINQIKSNQVYFRQHGP